jgi:hypothetical protein
MPDPSKVNKQQVLQNRPKRKTPRDSVVPIQSAGNVDFNSSGTAPWILALTVQEAIKQLLFLALSGQTTVKTVTADYTVLETDGVLLVDCTAGDIVISLLPASSVTAPQGRKIVVTKIDSSPNDVVLRASDGILIFDEPEIRIGFQWTSGTFLNNGVSYTAQ